MQVIPFTFCISHWRLLLHRLFHADPLHPCIPHALDAQLLPPSGRRAEVRFACPCTFCTPAVTHFANLPPHSQLLSSCIRSCIRSELLSHSWYATAIFPTRLFSRVGWGCAVNAMNRLHSDIFAFRQLPPPLRPRPPARPGRRRRCSERPRPPAQPGRRRRCSERPLALRLLQVRCIPVTCCPTLHSRPRHSELVPPARRPAARTCRGSAASVLRRYFIRKLATIRKFAPFSAPLPQQRRIHSTQSMHLRKCTVS